MSNTIGSLRSKFKEVIQIDDTTFEVDARKRGSVKHLSQHIFNIVEQMLQGVMVYDICTEVGQHLSKHFATSNQRIITWSKFSEICKPIFLEDTLELVTKDGVKGSLLIDLMEAMHLCCKVLDNHDQSTRNKYMLFIPATLTLDPIGGGLFVGMYQLLKWTTLDTSTSND